jgi:hypothetical protein
MTDEEIEELLKFIETAELKQDWYKGNPEFMTNTVTLITMDGLTKTINITGTPDVINSPLYNEGKAYGERQFKRDKFRDGEYREVPVPSEKKGWGELKSYRQLIKQIAQEFALQGDEENITLHVHKNVFSKIHREFAGKDPAKDLTYMEINTPSCKVFIRSAPKSEKDTKLVLAEDLKKMTLRELVDLKLAQEKT